MIKREYKPRVVNRTYVKGTYKLKNPYKTRKPSKLFEEKMQTKIVKQIKQLALKYKCLEWFMHYPSGQKRSIRIARKLKRMGTKKGIWDFFLPFKVGKYSGIYIELKYGYNSLTPEQKEFGLFVASQDYYTAICYTIEQTINVVIGYLEGKLDKPGVPDEKVRAYANNGFKRSEDVGDNNCEQEA